MSSTRRIVSIGCLLLVLVGYGSAAVAQSVTQPVSGAVSKPSGWKIGLPFKSGERIYVASGYSRDGGSEYHKRTNSTKYANDYYALDLTMLDHPQNGKGQPVVAIASGKVVEAGVGTVGWWSYGRRVYIEHDYNADGHKYISLYTHLDSLSVSTGDTVAKGQTIGKLGGSCFDRDAGQVDPDCYGFHLHFAIHRDSNIGGSGTGGSYGGNAVVPEPIDGYTGLKAGQTLTSKNTGRQCDCSMQGRTQSQMCGNCGQKTRTCDGCKWSGWSSCGGEGPCAQGETDSQTCGSGGSQTRTCRADCSWGAWSTCSGGTTGSNTDTGLVTSDTATGGGSSGGTSTGTTSGGTGDATIGSPPSVDLGGTGSSGPDGGAGQRGGVQTASCSTTGGAPAGPLALLLIAGLLALGRRKSDPTP